jgi:hypothetical protein
MQNVLFVSKIRNGFFAAVKAFLLLCAAFVLRENFFVYASAGEAKGQIEVSITDNEIDYRQELYRLIGLTGRVDKKRGVLILTEKSGEKLMITEKRCVYGDEVFICRFIYEGNLKFEGKLPLRAINISEVIKENYGKLKLKYTIYIDEEKIFIEGISNEKYLFEKGELFDLSKREKCSEELKNYFANLLSVINQGAFGKHDMHILTDNRPYLNREEEFFEFPYNDVYFVISETGGKLSENTLIAEKFIHKLSAGAYYSIYDEWEHHYNIPEDTVLFYNNWYAGYGNDYFITFNRDENTAKVLCRTLMDGDIPIEQAISELFPLVEVNFDDPDLIVPITVDERCIAGFLDSSVYLIQDEFMYFDDGDTQSGVYVYGDKTPLTAINLGSFAMYVYNFDKSDWMNTRIYYLSPNSAKDIQFLRGAEIGDTFEEIIIKMGYGQVNGGSLTYEGGGLRYMFTAPSAEGETDALYVSAIK